MMMLQVCYDHPAMAIRTANERDAGRICELYAQLGYGIDINDMTERVSMVASDRDREIYLACDEIDQAMGLVYVGLTLSIEHGTCAQILGLVVDEEQRGRGLGRELVMDAEAWACDHEVVRVQVNSRDEREDAHAFCTSLGYAVQKLQTRFVKPVGAGERPSLK